MIVLLLDSSGLGGIETHVATLSASLRDAGHCAHILFLADHGTNPFHQQLATLDLPFTVLDGRVASLWKSLKNIRPALLHTHGYKAGLIGRLVARALSLPVVSTFHAGERAPFPVSHYQWLDEWTSFLAQRIAVSRPIARSLPFGAVLIPNFIRIPEPVEAPARVQRVAFVGRLSPEKAPDRFCALARGARSGTRFDIYGDGPMRAGLEAEFGRHIGFHGFQADMEQVWSKIDLLVIPSRAEGLPMVALEAIARGIPLIATDVGALSTVIGDGEAGWLLPDEQDEAVVTGGVAALDMWLSWDEKARRDLRARAREWAIRHFSEGAAMAAILDVYAGAARIR